jgi:DNA-binding CsgD family transcriptional regulator
MRTVTVPPGLRARRISSPDGGEIVLFSFPLAPLPLHDRLTSAEREVVSSALRGDSNADVARTRGTSVRTVANQMASALRKLGVGSRGELAARFGAGDRGRDPVKVSPVRATPHLPVRGYTVGSAWTGDRG